MEFGQLHGGPSVHDGARRQLEMHGFERDGTGEFADGKTLNHEVIHGDVAEQLRVSELPADSGDDRRPPTDLEAREWRDVREIDHRALFQRHAELLREVQRNGRQNAGPGRRDGDVIQEDAGRVDGEVSGDLRGGKAHDSLAILA